MESQAFNAALLARIDTLLARLDPLLPPPIAPIDWDNAIAWRWQRYHGRGFLENIHTPHRITLADLCCVERQKEQLARNTRQFLHRHPANHALLWGSRGTGKSSLIKALLHEYAAQGLRLIEVDKEHLVDLPQIAALLHQRPERFILYCDDLSFEANDSRYKALKAILDGSINAPSDNILLYASSNRRHLLPEKMRDNLDARIEDGEIHPSETVEEQISLSERFGLWLSFHPFKQDDYLAIVEHWLGVLSAADFSGAARADREQARAAALQYALLRGSRSGRVAWQFARDWVGRRQLAANPTAAGPDC